MTNLLKMIRRDKVPIGFNVALLLGTAFAITGFSGSVAARDDNLSEIPADDELQIVAQTTADIPEMTDPEETVEEITVTGSRIRRDAFSSAAPLQVYDPQAARQLGITTITEMLTRSTVVNGQQINGTINTAAGNSNASEASPVGGVGSANVALRALEPERTLILLNGRRLGSSGIRGAPAQPDINLLPLSVVQTVEVITEGASSVYGADAVAGVVNVLLRDEFEGFELTATGEFPEAGGGEMMQFSMITGAQSDRAKFVFAAEFFERKRVRTEQRAECARDIVAIDNETGDLLDACSDGFFDNAVLDLFGPTPALGDIFAFYTPGQGNVLPDFSSGATLATQGIVDIPPGYTDDDAPFIFGPQFGSGDETLRSDLVQPLTRYSLVALGSYQPDWFGGEEELYFEAYHFNRHALNRAGTEQIFPGIPGQIPQDDGNGGLVRDSEGDIAMFDNPLNPFAPAPVAPILTIDTMQQIRDVELQHTRFVGGFRGDIPSGWFEERNWSYDLFFSYDRGVGFQSQPVLNEVNLDLTLDTTRFAPGVDPTQGNKSDLTCGLNHVFDVGFRTPQDCVVVDFFADSLFESLALGDPTDGRFATQEENDFLIFDRLNRTVVEQSMFAGYLTGDLFDIPTGGTVGVAFGGEWREDSIDSQVEFLGSTGNIAAENNLSEGATRGSRTIIDLYGEVNIPLVVDREMVEYFGVEGALRYTDEENFGSEVTERVRALYRPVDWVQISGSWGTSFRAPNLRETFLAEQTGSIDGRADPCSIPRVARPGGVYDPTLDPRTQTTLDNCVQSGADPTQLGLEASVTIPVVVGGNATDLLAEESRSFTATVQVEPPISDRFNLQLALSFFDIEIEDTIRVPQAQTILERCFQGPANLASPFCDRVERDTGPNVNPLFNFPSAIDASFINVGLERSQGVDLNTRFSTQLDNLFGDQPVNILWSTATTFQTDRKEQVFLDDPEGPEILLKDFGVPKRRFKSTLSVSTGNFEALFETRHFSGTQAPDSRLDDPEDCFVDEDLLALETDSATAVCSAPGPWYQDVALTYRFPSFSLTAGVNNVFDKSPPLVAPEAGSNRANLVTSSGYDLFGRSFFFTATASF